MRVDAQKIDEQSKSALGHFRIYRLALENGGFPLTGGRFIHESRTWEAARFRGPIPKAAAPRKDCSSGAARLTLCGCSAINLGRARCLGKGPSRVRQRVEIRAGEEGR